MTDIQKENKSGGKVPNLRFPNFYSDWEVKKLGEISTNKSKKREKMEERKKSHTCEKKMEGENNKNKNEKK